MPCLHLRLCRQRKHFDGEALNVLMKNTKRNAYMALPENVLLIMLDDLNTDVGAEGVKITPTLRTNIAEASQPVHPFRAPAVDAAAASYKGLVDGRADVEPPSIRARPKENSRSQQNSVPKKAGWSSHEAEIF